MGVPKFYGYWLRRQRIVGLSSSYLPENIHSLYIDLNPLIHHVCQRVYSYGEYAGTNPPPGASVGSGYDLVFALLRDEIIRLVRQSGVGALLYLAVDGPAPQAKVNQQRARRFSSAPPQPGEFDSNAISPGTELMFYLDQNLAQWLTQEGTFSSLRVIYSPHTVYGEGEHKIMDYLRNLPEAPSGNVVIHGLDTDLIFLSMLAPIRHMYLWREPQGSEEQIVINIVNLRRAITEKYGHVGNFVTLMNLIGNDFLPGQTSLSDFTRSIDAIEAAYNQVRQELNVQVVFLIDSAYNIIWDNLLLVLNKLAQIEPELLQDKARTNFQFKPELLLASINGGILDMNQFRDRWNSDLIANRPLGMPPVPISWVCQDYLGGFQWVMKYYTGGSYNYLYHYKFFRAPLLADVVTYLQENITAPVRSNIWAENEDYRRYTLWENLLMLLPNHSRPLLPREIQTLESTELIPLFPASDQVVKIYDGVNDEWMGRPIVPIISLKQTTGILDRLQIPEWPQSQVIHIN